MRGHDEQTSHMFSYLSPEQRVPADHPLRAIRTLTDHALRALSPTSYHRRGLRPPLRSIESLETRDKWDADSRGVNDVRGVQDV